MALAALIAGGFWYYWSGLQREAAELPPVVEEREVPDELPRIGPLHPIAESEFAVEGEDQAELVELPPLGESDAYLKLELAELFGDSIANLIAESRVIERVVASVDNLPRTHVAERMRPLTPLAGAFEVYEEGISQYAISQDTYERFDPLVAIVTSVDTADLLGLYRRYYSMFQTAYVDLGYPDGYFNDRLVETIDDMLATPEVADPIMLVRPHVLYEFADPDLEARSAGQKLMLRMGSENAAQIKSKLRELREAITAS